MTNRALEKSDIVVVGAGVIGSAVAMGLARLGAKVQLVDLDLDGTLSSSELNAGGVRATFNQPINVAASRASIDYFASVANEVGYRDCGYLWLCNEDQRRAREKQIPLWEREKWPVESWSKARIQERYPILNRLDDVSIGLYGKRDGLLNPNLLKLHYREVARANGAEFVDRHRLRTAKRAGGKWMLGFEVFPMQLSDEKKREIYGTSAAEAGGGSTEAFLEADVVVNCAGAWSSEVARILGYTTFATPIRRQISLFDCRIGDASDYGMVIDTSGVYFHPESTFFLSGICNDDEPEGVNFEYSGEEFFQERIWMPLSERASAFEQLKHISGWAGLYEVSPDDSAIIGAAPANAAPGVFEAHSFSGHGVMHSYAAGIALAERILHGRYESFDFSPLAGERFITGKPVSETAVI